jgi:hypothetical protein
MRLREVIRKRIEQEADGLSARAEIQLTVAANLAEPGSRQADPSRHEPDEQPTEPERRNQ